jgi:UDP-2,3-diacylglucosamine pyrophosphatase LpxH
MDLAQPTLHHRALFLSDLHLGAMGSRADRLLEFLRGVSADTIYLVGDVLDLWHPRRPVWGQAEEAVLSLLSDRADRGTRVVYLIGNHDAAALADRRRLPPSFEIALECLHRAGNGRSYLVLHGDVADARIFRSHLSTRIGSWTNSGLRRLDLALSRLRRQSRVEQRSLIEAALAGVNALMALGSRHERRLIAMARALGQDGVICGHFHKPMLHHDHGLTYANCGDWMDSFTSLAEDADGHLKLIRWQGASQDARAGRDDATLVGAAR